MEFNNEDPGSDAAQGRSDSPTMDGSPNVTFSSPPIDQRAVNQQQSHSNHGGTSDRKRSRRAMADDGALDDILGQITSKLTTLSTKEKCTEEDSINAFVDVLNCSRSEAEFYLESSNWNVETAAMLWLENNPTNVHSSAYLPSLAYGAATYASAPYYNSKLAAGGGGDGSAFQRPRSQPRYRPRTVLIEGLPKEWTARVSKHTGQVYFMHVATGVTQYCVPTGYADLPGSGSPENAIDLSSSHKGNSNGHKKKKSSYIANSGNGDDEDVMLDLSRDSDNSSMEGEEHAVDDEEIEPLSPVADPLGINMMQNTIAQAQYSTHSTYHAPHSGSKSSSGGAFRDAMDEYANPADANSVNSSKAVWDEGSGYSLNDGPAYSVSSTTTNSSVDDNSSVFGNMASRHAFGTANATSDNTNNTNDHSTNNPIHSTLPYYAQQGAPVTQDMTPTEGQLHSARTSGIAMLTPTDTTGSGSASGGSGGHFNGNGDNGDYFFGPFTPGRDSNGSSTTTLTK